MKLSALILFVATFLITPFSHASPGPEVVISQDGGYGYVLVLMGNRQGEVRPIAYFSSVFSYCSATFPRRSAETQAQDELKATSDLPSSLLVGSLTSSDGGYDDRGEAIKERRKSMAEWRRAGRYEIRTFSFTFYDENC